MGFTIELDENWFNASGMDQERRQDIKAVLERPDFRSLEGPLLVKELEFALKPYSAPGHDSRAPWIKGDSQYEVRDPGYGSAVTIIARIIPE